MKNLFLSLFVFLGLAALSSYAAYTWIKPNAHQVSTDVLSFANADRVLSFLNNEPTIVAALIDGLCSSKKKTKEQKHTTSYDNEYRIVKKTLQRILDNLDQIPEGDSYSKDCNLSQYPVGADKLDWCLCGDAPKNERLNFTLTLLVETLSKHQDKTKTIIYVSMGAAGMLHDCIIVSELCHYYDTISVNLIDPVYANNAQLFEAKRQLMAKQFSNANTLKSIITIHMFDSAKTYLATNPAPCTLLLQIDPFDIWFDLDKKEIPAIQAIDAIVVNLANAKEHENKDLWIVIDEDQAPIFQTTHANIIPESLRDTLADLASTKNKSSLISKLQSELSSYTCHFVNFTMEKECAHIAQQGDPNLIMYTLENGTVKASGKNGLEWKEMAFKRYKALHTPSLETILSTTPCFT